LSLSGIPIISQKSSGKGFSSLCLSHSKHASVFLQRTNVIECFLRSRW
jgi:hypothetical protein